MALKIGIIHNPKSKKNLKTQKFSRPELEKILEKYHGTGAVIETSDTGDSLYAAIEQFKALDIDVLGSNGGDGTLVYIFPTLFDIYQGKPLPSVAPMNGGTMNNLAYVCNARGNPKKVMKNLVTADQDDITTLSHSLVHVHDNDHNKDYYGQIFAASPAVSEFLSQYYSSEVPGISDVAGIIAKVFVSKEHREKFTGTMKAEIRVGNYSLNCTEHMLVFASVVPRIATGLNLFNHADGDHMHVVVPHYGVAQNLGNVARGAAAGVAQSIGMSRISQYFRPKSSNFFESRASTMYIECPSGFEIVLDSEVLPRTSSVTIDSYSKVPLVRFK